MVEVALEDVRRERIALPLLRDERPELQVRELGRIIAERAGLALMERHRKMMSLVAHPGRIAAGRVLTGRGREAAPLLDRVGSIRRT